MPDYKKPLPFIPLESLIERIPSFRKSHDRIQSISAGGFVLAINLNEFFRPELAFSSFPRAWFELYTELDLLLLDPVLRWAAVNSGTTRWSHIAKSVTEDRSQRVLDLARAHGLNFGAIISTRNAIAGLKRCFLSCAHSDREFTDGELSELTGLFQEVIKLRGLTSDLTEAGRAVLSLLAAGRTQIEIAEHLGVSRETVKKRLERARIALGARNASHAVAVAIEGSLISAFD